KTYNIRYENNKVRKPMTYKLSDELINTLENVGRRDSGLVFHSVTDKDKKMDKGTIRGSLAKDYEKTWDKNSHSRFETFDRWC
ncbi:hypothetical protein ACPF04_12195, partial [Campylobacter sp. MOP51]